MREISTFNLLRTCKRIDSLHYVRNEFTEFCITRITVILSNTCVYSRTAAGDVNIAQPVEEANDSQSTSSRALSAEAVPLEEIAHAVFNYDDGLAELITLEEMYMKVLHSCTILIH